MEKWFRRFVRLSIVSIYLVLIAGSVVRMSGSGMGCPDWPKCFGYLIPPTDEAQVLWEAGRSFEKGQMIVYDNALWTANRDFVTADSLEISNWTKYTKHDYAIFNPLHTWTEYINRLLGAFSGIPALIVLVLAMIRIKENWKYFALALLAVLMLGFEAWLGKVVVDGNLVPGQITIHMAGAFLLIFFNVKLLTMVESKSVVVVSKKVRWILSIILIALFIQIISGTQVREIVDSLYAQFPRIEWVSNLGWKFKFHRSFANALVILGFLLYWEYRKGRMEKALLWVPGIIVVEALSGIVLNYAGMPAAMQPLHLFLSAVLFGIVIYRLGTQKNSIRVSQ